MKHFIDGDHICVTRDDFVNLQESAAVFVPRNSGMGRIIERKGLLFLALGDLLALKNELDANRKE